MVVWKLAGGERKLLRRLKVMWEKGVVREILNPHAVLRNNKRFIATIKIIATAFY